MKKSEEGVSGLPDDSNEPNAQCVTAGDWIFLSGQPGVDEDGELVSLDFVQQATQAFDNVRKGFEAVGSDLDDTVHITAWLTDLRYLNDFVSVKENALAETKVASTAIGTRKLSKPGMQVLVEARGTKGDKRVIDSPGLPDADDIGDATYAPGVAAGSLVYLSGQNGVDENAEPVSSEFRPQMQQVLENVKRGLEAADSSLKDMLHMTTWPLDERNTDHFTNVRSEMLGKDVTTSTRLGASELAEPELLVEMEAVGAKPSVGKTMIDHPDDLELSTTTRDGQTYPRYWYGVTADEWIFTAGMVGRHRTSDGEFQPVSREFEPQVRQVFENIESVLKSADASLRDILHTRTYLTDMRRIDEYERIVSEVMEDVSFTETVIDSPWLAESELLLETEVIAVKQ